MQKLQYIKGWCSMKEENATLKNIYDNGTKSLNGTMGTTLSTKSNDSYQSLSTSMNTVIGSLGIDTWDDAISAEINSTTKTGIDKMIEACKSPADKIMTDVGTSVDNFNESFLSYRETIKQHNAKYTEYTNYSVGNKPSDTDSEAYSAWKDRCDKKASLKGELDTLAASVTTKETHCTDIVTKIQGLLSPIASTASTSALGMTTGTVSDYSGESGQKYGYGDDYKVSGTRVLDPTGKLLSETYTIVSPTGEVVETGEITYNPDGVPVVKNFYKKPEEPTTLDAVTKADVEENPAVLAGYVTGEYVPAEEKSDTTVVLGEENPDGTQDYTESTEYEKAYTNGVTVEGERTETGVIEGTEQVPEHATDKFVVTATDGTQYNGVTETEYGPGGRTYDADTTLTDQEGNVVLTAEDERVAGYTDNLTGAEVAVNTVAVTTPVFDEQGNKIDETITVTRDETYIAGGEDYGGDTHLSYSAKDPQVGTITDEDGVTKTYYRAEDGTLMVREEWDSGDFLWWKGKHHVEESAVGEEYATLIITNTDGTTNSVRVNMASDLDVYNQVTLAYEDARMEAGWKADHAREGIHFLYDMNEPIEIYNGAGDTTCTMQLVYDE